MTRRARKVAAWKLDYRVPHPTSIRTAGAGDTARKLVPVAGDRSCDKNRAMTGRARRVAACKLDYRVPRPTCIRTAGAGDTARKLVATDPATKITT